MEAFEKMAKREERRKEALQRISEKKEPVVVEEKTTNAVKVTCQTRTMKAKAKPAAPRNVTKPAARRKRKRSSPGARQQAVRQQSSNSEPVAAASRPSSDVDQTGNSEQATTSGEDDSNVPSCRIPVPSEVGSTHTGTVSTSSLSLGFRLPKTKKVCVTLLEYSLS